MDRALVTGASGYIGSSLVRRLVRLGVDTHVLVRPSSDLSVLKHLRQRIRLHEYDGTTESVVRATRGASPEVVFHLASMYRTAHRSEELVSLIESNVLLTAQLADALSICGSGCLVNTGTSWQFGEAGTYSPANLYAATKQASEDILAYYSAAAGIGIVSLLLSDTYGPDDPRGKLMSSLWECALTGRIMDLSPGEQLLDLVYIDDVVDAFIAAAAALERRDLPQVRYSVSSSNPISLANLVDLFERVAGCKPVAKLGARPYRSREVMVPWSSGPLLPGWSPKVTLWEGILRARPDVPPAVPSS